MALFRRQPFPLLHTCFYHSDSVGKASSILVNSDPRIVLLSIRTWILHSITAGHRPTTRSNLTRENVLWPSYDFLLWMYDLNKTERFSSFYHIFLFWNLGDRITYHTDESEPHPFCGVIMGSCLMMWHLRNDWFCVADEPTWRCEWFILSRALMSSSGLGSRQAVADRAERTMIY